MEQIDCIVVGAGVVGLAVARALAQQGREVMVLEAANAFGTGISSRNSEVIHAGFYYPTGSRKAALCVRGAALLYDYAAARGIGHRRCGKLVVATDAAQVDKLHALQQQGAINGVPGLTLIDGDAARALEPALSPRVQAALHSPHTGIVDTHGLMLALLGDVEHAGGSLVCHAPVTAITRGGDSDSGGWRVHAAGEVLHARTVVNAAGLGAVALARATEGLDARHVPTAHWAKGSYFTLSGRAPFGRLIYPVPEHGTQLAGLGVHLTLDLGGQAKFGPDVQWVESPDDLQVDARKAPAFEAAVRQYWPGLPEGALQAGYAGMRPKISGPGEAAADFVIQGPADHGLPGLVNLLGIESPGLTSSMGIGEVVVGLLAG